MSYRCSLEIESVGKVDGRGRVVSSSPPLACK